MNLVYPTLVSSVESLPRGRERTRSMDQENSAHYLFGNDTAVVPFHGNQNEEELSVIKSSRNSNEVSLEKQRID